MCGICGWIGTRPSPGAAEIGGMLAALRRRGPDDCGVWTESDGRAVLGHTRLSIIDLVGSKQPMTNEDGSIVVTYNGEIYNFADLRRHLLARGHTFATRGDTEVLVHLYEEYGAEMVRRLDGMFAFGLYDRPRRRLLLARDRIGIKPLYYWHDAATGAVLFASDMGALLEHPSVPRELNPRALAHYLQFGYVVHPEGWVRSVRQVEPGEVVEWEEGRVTRTKYYTWEYQPCDDLDNGKRAEAELRRHLTASVQAHLVADVPLGSFLSGGLDSATVTGLAQRTRGNAEAAIHSLTVRFGTPEFDESGRARSIAGDLGTRHTEIDGRSLRFDRPFLDQFVGALGEPFGDTSALAVYLLCMEARAHVKVALSGDGGDELFFGYTGIWKQQWARRWRILPSVVRRAIRASTAGRRGALPRRLHRSVHLSLFDDPGVIIEWARRWEWGTLRQLLGDNVFATLFPDSSDPFPEVRSLIGPGTQGGFLEQASRFHLLVDLPCDCLWKVDRMSMAHGLEVRVPLLANQMLDYAAQLPLQMRKRGSRTKEPLRSIATTLAPTLTQPAAKHGFGFPLEAWVRDDLGRFWREWGLTARLAEVGFAPVELDRMVALYAAIPRAENSYRARLWATRLFDLMLLALWVERHRIRL